MLQKIKEVSSFGNSSSGYNYRTVYNEQYGVFIDTTRIVMIEEDGKHTITFRIASEEDNDEKIENLILKSKEDGSYSAYIAEYSLSEQEMEVLYNGEALPDKTPSSLTEISSYSQAAMSISGNGADCVSLYTYTVMLCNDADGNTIQHNGDTDGRCHSNWQEVQYTFLSINVDCLSGGGPGNGYNPGDGGYNPGDGGYNPGNGGYNPGMGGPGNGGTNPGNGSNPTNPGNGNTNPNNPQNPDISLGNPIFTTPIINLNKNEIKFQNFYNSLTEEQQAVVDANSTLFFDYLVENNFSQEAKEFAGEIINAYLNNTLISAIPFFKYPQNSNYVTLYPNTTEYIKNKIPQLSQNQFILNKLVEFSELSMEEVLSDLKWGNGPTIEITQLDVYGTETYGVFNKNTPDKLYIDIDIVNMIENSTSGPQGDALVFLLGVTILHEYVHYGDNIDGIDQPGEEGLLFEIATYGEAVWLSNAQNILIKWQQD